MFDISTLSKLTQRPSAAKAWQHPSGSAAPIPAFPPLRPLPLEEQDASYFAASANIESFSYISIKKRPPSLKKQFGTDVLYTL